MVDNWTFVDHRGYWLLKPLITLLSDAERLLDGLWSRFEKTHCGLQRKSVLDRPCIRDQEYLDGGGRRNEEAYLILSLRYRDIELLQTEAILLCCLVRALRSRTKKSRFLHSPHATVNASNVRSFRTVAEIKNLVLAISKRSLIVEISEGIDLGSYV